MIFLYTHFCWDLFHWERESIQSGSVRKIPDVPPKNHKNSPYLSISSIHNHPQSTSSQVKHNGFAVIHAQPELRRDPEIALAAVSDRGFVLRYLEDALKAGERRNVPSMGIIW